MMAQEENEMKWKFCPNGTVISVQAGWNGKLENLQESPVFSRKFAFDPRVPLAFHGNGSTERLTKWHGKLPWLDCASRCEACAKGKALVSSLGPFGASTHGFGNFRGTIEN